MESIWIQLWNKAAYIIRHAWLTIFTNLSSRFRDFSKSQKSTPNWNNSCLMKKYCAWDSEEENQQNFCGFKQQLQNTFWNHLKPCHQDIVIICQFIYYYYAKSVIWNVYSKWNIQNLSYILLAKHFDLRQWR